jgi:putative PIG3 family NAD(P)H quinone oxidoreductase
MPDLMHVIVFDSYGPPSVLRLAEQPVPAPGPAEILIRVEAAGVSRADILQRQGHYPLPPGASPILGLDVAGTVASVGSQARNFQPGDRVCALVNGGGYAEFCVVPETQVLPIPESWSAIEAATLPENLFTVYDNVSTRAHLHAGEIALIHGGTSGIGSMGIMLARALGAVPYATAGTDQKCEACRSIGAEAAINYRSVDFVQTFYQLTARKGADVVVDIVGGAYLEKNIDVLATEGRLALLAVLEGSAGTLPISKLMIKRGTIVASTMRPRSTVEKGSIAARLKEDIWPLLPQKQFIRPLIDSTFPLAEAAAAHERLESAHIGKIVLIASS